MLQSIKNFFKKDEVSICPTLSPPKILPIKTEEK
jgi:hypothetical protein